MLISGLQKLTLLDYPGRVACTVFTGGCNFRCPFCHNAPLVLPEQLAHDTDEEQVLAFLKKRVGVLDGVAITGGEPLLHKDIGAFLAKVKALGYQIKLDTNGSFPELLMELVKDGLVDRVAMDIKNSPAHYARTVGLPHFDLSPVRESAAMLMAGSLPFEFRTTVVNELHTQEDMTAIGQWLAGTENYYLQYFVDEDSVLRPGLHAPSKEKMQAFLQILRQTIPNAHIRGEEND